MLSTAALLEPGVLYTVILAISTLAALVIGPVRFSPERLVVTRWKSLFRESAGWFFAMVFVSALARSVVGGRAAIGISSVFIPAFYVPIHIAILAGALRRLFGCVQAGIYPKEEDKRLHTRSTRTGQGVLIVVLAMIQVYLVLLFAALGPNPAMRLLPARAEIVENSSDLSRREFFLIERSKDRVIGFDPERSALIDIPLSQISFLTVDKFSQRQKNLLSAVEDSACISEVQCLDLFPVRDNIRRLEIDQLIRIGAITRAKNGKLCKPAR